MLTSVYLGSVTAHQITVEKFSSCCSYFDLACKDKLTPVVIITLYGGEPMQTIVSYNSQNFFVLNPMKCPINLRSGQRSSVTWQIEFIHRLEKKKKTRKFNGET